MWHVSAGWESELSPFIWGRHRLSEPFHSFLTCLALGGTGTHPDPSVLPSLLSSPRPAPHPDHALAFIRGILVPHRPHLDAEEGRPAGDVGQHNDKAHLHGSDLGPRDGADTADPGRQFSRGRRWGRRRGPAPNLPVPSFYLFFLKKCL